jgi:hypothetical protein
MKEGGERVRKNSLKNEYFLRLGDARLSLTWKIVTQMLAKKKYFARMRV